MIKATKGFYLGSENTELKNKFLEQLNICWLYAPNNVIQQGYVFLMSVSTNKKSSDEEKELALGNFISMIRKDMLDQNVTKKTMLTGNNYKHWKAN